MGIFKPGELKPMPTQPKAEETIDKIEKISPIKLRPAPVSHADYAAKYEAAKVLPAYEASLKSLCGKILAHKDLYEKVQAATGMPWKVVACIHSLEGSLNFGTHLHNGDSLSARTVRVPAGRPKVGKPPFSWYESAIDALGGANAHKGKDWSIGAILAYLEAFNGMGYRRRGIPSPYLWSFTDQYTKGKYVADGKFDANAVSKQAGAVAILKTLDQYDSIVEVRHV